MHTVAVVGDGPAATGALVLVLVAVGFAATTRVAVRVGVAAVAAVIVGSGVTVAGSGVVVTGTKMMNGVWVAARVGWALFWNTAHPVEMSATAPNAKTAI